MRLRIRRFGDRVEIGVFVGGARVGRIRGQVYRDAPGLPPLVWVAHLVLILPRFRGDHLGTPALAEAVRALQIPAVSGSRAHAAGLVGGPSPGPGIRVWELLAAIVRVEDGVAYPEPNVVR